MDVQSRVLIALDPQHQGSRIMNQFPVVTHDLGDPSRITGTQL